MNDSNLFLIFVKRFNQIGLKYMVSGSVASIIYGEPRLTHDIDLIVQIKENDIDSIIKNFPLEEFYSPPEEIIKIEILRSVQGHFNLLHHPTGFKADIYPLISNELNNWAFENIKKYFIGNEKIFLAPIEYVIIKKLEYFREGGSEKHIRDIRGILKVSGNSISESILKKFLEKYNLVDYYDLCLK